MTRLALLPTQAARSVLDEALGDDHVGISGVADLIRGEVWARRACQRSFTIRRVLRLTAPLASLDETLVAKVCDLLERQGDVVFGPGGVLFATPLRAIDLGGGEFRIASTFPTKHLASLLGGSWNVVATTRTYRVNDAAWAKDAIAAAGGVVLSPTDWACLDRVACADDAWLDSLDRRLQAQSESPGSPGTRRAPDLARVCHHEGRLPLGTRGVGHGGSPVASAEPLGTLALCLDPRRHSEELALCVVASG